VSRNDARDDARREMLSWSDHRPACPRCADLLEVGARWCPECGARVVDKSVEVVENAAPLDRERPEDIASGRE